MAIPLLETKLHLPPLRPTRVQRPRLFARLNAGLRPACKLILISAPAGFGKTTLLSEWARQIDRPVAWLSLDEGDDDPARFWDYLVAALSSLPGFSSSPDLAGLGAPGEDELTLLLNGLGQLPSSAALVLDDYHLVANSAVHDQVAFLLAHLPPALHLVIATRADPPLPVARLRARGQLVEIRQQDLCFSEAEAAAFLQQVMGLALSAEEVAALSERTEGWIAGLQMAAVSMQQRDDVAGFVRAFAGSHRYVMDYLMEEVLGRQSADLQAFLLHTSILERLCAPLCDAVCPQRPDAGSQATLEYLEGANLFVTALDDRREWYRYHRLFADLLQRQLAERGAEQIPGLHRRASAWYEAHELLPESIQHALAAGDVERAATMIEQVVEPLLMRSEVTALRRWLGALPVATLDRHPELCAYHAWLLLLGGAPLRSVESQIAAVTAHIGSPSSLASGRLQSVRALIALFQGQIDHAAALVDDARATLSEDDGFWYGIAQWMWEVLQVSEAGSAEETAPLERLIHSQIERQNVLLAVVGLCNVGELRAKQGRLREAETLFRRALAQATDAAGERLPIAGEPLIWLGELARERNDLSAAEHYLCKGIELLARWGRIAAIEGHVSLARLRQAQGDNAGTRDVLDEAERLAKLFDATEIDDHVVALARARIAALQDDWPTVARWVKARGLDALDPGNLQIDATMELHVRKYEVVALALARIRAGQPREALTFLGPLLSEVAAKGRWGLGIEILALQAAAHHMLGNTAQALACLEESLARAEPEGHTRLYIDIGAPMAQLLYEAAQRGIHAEYAGRLLAAFPKPAAPPAAPQQAEGLIEPLSEREHDVLAAIAEGLSNQEIAARLYISERTVKWHASNIYGKLQVSNRTEAVAKARALGILQDNV
jgi:LuxR family maltose regulon positive regulatory protein